MALMFWWDLDTKKYVPYTPPENCTYGFSTSGDDRVINCARCGAVIAPQTMYSSYLLQDEHGFGYGICGACMTKELHERKAHASRKKESE